MKLQMNDIVLTETEEFVVTGWLQGKEMPDDTIRITRDRKVVYERGETK